MSAAETPVYYMPRPVDEHGGAECFAFTWCGQSFRYCDNCGNPYWEHTHFEAGQTRDGKFRHVRHVIPADLRAKAREHAEKDPKHQFVMTPAYYVNGGVA
jgi:hypothetical protein